MCQGVLDWRIRSKRRPLIACRSLNKQGYLIPDQAVDAALVKFGTEVEFTRLLVANAVTVAKEK